MKKITKLLSVFLIAGAVGTGVAGISACSTKEPETPEHVHTAADEWQSDANGHWHNCTADDGAKLDAGAHVYDDDQDTTCNTCGYERTVTPPPAAGFVIPATAEGIIVEGYGDAEVQLSPEKTSHTIDKSAIKVYLSVDGVKGDEVPAENLQISIKDPTNHDCEWSNLKADGAYKISVSVINATIADGSDYILDDFVSTETVTVHNAIIENSLAVKEGATLTQVQSVQDKMTSTWTYEVTRANGEKEDVTVQVTVTGLDTNTIATDATANLSCTIGTLSVTGTVKYSITENEALHTKTYAANFASYEATIVATGTKFIDGEGTTLTMMADKSDMKQKVQAYSASHEEDNKYFAQRFTFDGGSFTSTGGTQGNRYLKLDVDGAAKLTIYYSASSADRGVAVYDSTYEFAALTTSVEPLAKGIITATNTVHKLEVSLPKAGTYMITTATKDSAYFHYFEVSTEFEDENGTDITLAAGEDVARKIELSTPETIPVLKVGSTFATAVTGITVIKSNTVNCAMTKVAAEDWATETTYLMGEVGISAETVITADMLGQQTITVTYGGFSATYKVTVEAAVDGITGITASDTLASKQVDTEDGTIAFTKNDIKIDLVGENAGASVTSYTVKVDGVALTDTVNLTSGTHTVEVTATVEAGTQNAEFTDTFTIIISVKPAEGAVVPLAINFDGINTGTEDLEVKEDVELSFSSTFVTAVVTKSTSEKASKYKVKSDTEILANATSGDVIATVSSCFGTNGGIKTAQCSVAVTLAAGNYKITMYTKQTGTDRVCNIIATDGSTKLTADTINGAADGTISTEAMNISVFNSVAGGGTIYIGGSNNIDIYYIVITPVQAS